MDADYQERMQRVREASDRMFVRMCQTVSYSTVLRPRKRFRGMKRRQRLMVRRLMIAKLERMAAKGIVPETLPIIP